MHRRAGMLIVATALVGGACSGGETAETTLPAARASGTSTTSTTSTIGTTTAPPSAPSTSTPEPPTTSATSPITWSRVADVGSGFAPSVDQAMLHVTAGGPGLVAVGWENDPGGAFDAAVWATSDGRTWSRAPLDEAARGGGSNQVMLSVTAGGPGLVAVGLDDADGDEDAAVWTSPDAVTWTRVEHDEAIFGGPDDQRMVSVTAGGPGLVAVGWAGDGEGSLDAAVWTSADGTTWSRVPGGEALGGDAAQRMFAIAPGAGGLVAVGVDESRGDEDAAAWTSSNGADWVRVPHDAAIFGGEGAQLMLDIVAEGTGLVAVGLDRSGEEQDGAVWTSRDGTTWARVPHDEDVFGGEGNQAMVAVSGTTGALVAVGIDDATGFQDAAIWTSVERASWDRVPHDAGILGGDGDQVMWSVTTGGPGRVAVGWEGIVGGGQHAAAWVDTG